MYVRVGVCVRAGVCVCVLVQERAARHEISVTSLIEGSVLACRVRASQITVENGKDSLRSS
jgi:hypothetical protein